MAETDRGTSGPAEALSKNDIARFSRQLILDDVGPQGQLALKKSSVLVIGCGGLGCPVAAYLAAGGVGVSTEHELGMSFGFAVVVGDCVVGLGDCVVVAAVAVAVGSGVCDAASAVGRPQQQLCWSTGRVDVLDDDVVDTSNLHRQILHTEARQGLSKAYSIAESIRSINSSVKCRAIHERLSPELARELVPQYSCIVDCTDNAPTRYLAGDAAAIYRKPLISGAAVRTEGQLSVYGYKGGPCYRCIFPQPPPAETVTNCSEGGVLGVVPGIIGTMMALETIKVLMDKDTNLSGKLFLFEAMSFTTRTVRLRGRRDDCPVCGEADQAQLLDDYEAFCHMQACDAARSLNIIAAEQRISPVGLKTVLSGQTFSDMGASKENASRTGPRSAEHGADGTRERDEKDQEEEEEEATSVELSLSTGVEVAQDENGSRSAATTRWHVVDVRAPVEFDICRLQPSINIPLRVWSRLSRLQSSRTTKLDADTKRLEALIRQLELQLESAAGETSHGLLFVCRRGNDSQRAVLALEALRDLDLKEGDVSQKAAGQEDQADSNRQFVQRMQALLSRVKLADLQGGLHAWAKLDDTFPVY